MRGQGLQFTLHQYEPGKWNLSGKNSEGSRVQSRYEASSLEAAIEVSAKRLGISCEPEPSDLTISRVLYKWVESRDVKPDTRNGQYANVVMAFLTFCEKQGLRCWAELQLEHLEAWRNLCKRKYHGWTPYHYVGKIKMAVRWASRNWRGRFENFGEGLIAPKPGFREMDEDRDALRLEQVLEFCLFLRNHPKGWDILPAVCLCGLAGLGVTEALRLSWDRVSFKEGFIDITDEVKNSHRKRRIPLPAFAWYVLREAPRNGDRVVWKHNAYPSYGRKFCHLFKEWGYAPRTKPSDLREVLQTHAEVEGWDGYILDRYVGHAGKTIRQVHYTKRAQSTLLAEMRSKITSRIDEILSEWNEKCEQNVNPKDKSGLGI